MKTLPNKTNETFEESCQRKAKVLEEIYTIVQNYPEDNISNIITDVIEFTNDQNIKE